MAMLTDDQINEIAEQLDCGFICFWNKESGELIFIPDATRYSGMDEDIWSDELEKIERNQENYNEIESLKSFESFKIMENFVYTLVDSSALKGKLKSALNKKKPFREFKFVIDNSGEYRQKWFDFKNEALIQVVRDRIEAIGND